MTLDLELKVREGSYKYRSTALAKPANSIKQLVRSGTRFRRAGHDWWVSKVHPQP